MNIKRKTKDKLANRRKSRGMDVKKIILYTFALLVVAALYLFLANIQRNEEPVETPQGEPRFRKDSELIFYQRDGTIITTIDIEIVSDPISLTQGLMHRRALDDNHGMLFIFGTTHNVEMWMKDTYISLDMIFVRDDGTIADIATHTVPFSTDIIRSNVPVKYVIEVNAGFTDRHGIETGHRVQWY